MRVHFKQAVHLRGKDSKGRDYSPGVHEVPDDHLQSPFFNKLLQAGLVTSTSADVKTIHAETFQERQMRLAERIAKKVPKESAQLPMASQLQVSEEAPLPASSETLSEPLPSVTEAASEEVELPVEEDQSKKKNHKHKR